MAPILEGSRPRILATHLLSKCYAHPLPRGEFNPAWKKQLSGTIQVMKKYKFQQYVPTVASYAMLDCRFVIILSSQIVLLLFAYYVSFLLRFDFRLTSQYKLIVFETLPIIFIVKLPIFYAAGLFRGWWRYVGTSDLLDITKAGAAAFF